MSSYNQHASVVGTLSKSIPAGSTISVMTSNPNSGLGEGAFAFVYNGNIIHEALINRKWNGQAGSAAAYPGVGNYYIGVTIPAGTQVYISPWYGGSPTVNFSDPTSMWEFAFKIN